MTLRSLTVATAALLMACDSETTAPSGTHPGTTVPPTAPTAVSLVISPNNGVIPLGRTKQHVAIKVMSDGSSIPVSSTWVSFAPDIVSMDVTGIAVGVGVGRATIQASADGFVTTSTITVARPTNTGTSDALLVEEFSMIEMQFPPAPSWAYAPQIRARVAPGRAVTLLEVSFSIPGLGQIPAWNCLNVLSAYGSSEFNGEVYGEWAFTIGGANRALGSDVTAAIMFLDDKGIVATRTVPGKIVAGALPSTVTGGNLGGACFNGYRPPG